MKQADLVVTVNIACKRIFESRSCPAEKISVVMNSPDDRIFPLRSPGSYRVDAGSRGRRFAIMYHGSIVERNGLDLAIEALSLVKRTISGAELRIYGVETPFLGEVMELARRKGIAKAVHYLGPKRLEDLVAEIERCDVGIIPNHRNTFTEINTPTRILEYLALGKPVIAPRATGICDYFDDTSLILFELGNAEDLARKLEAVFFHPAKARKIAERGQAVYREHAWPAEKARLTSMTAGLLNSRLSVAARAS
jgi:glycosyltransferase involved in cell wall biosynthesis